MNTPKLFTIVVVSAGLAFGAAAQGHEKEKEETISNADVPAAVQQAAETQAKGGRIVRWEKEGTNYEAVIEKDGKQWGFKFDAKGKVVSKHDEGKEKGEKY
jgi:YD repeat-containing protein